jgi:Uma2 family endonuclease
MPVSEGTYERVALEDPAGGWELVCGRLRSKPGMTIEHGQTIRSLDHLLVAQLEAAAPGVYTVSAGTAKLRIPTSTYYVPDLCVLPLEFVRRKRRDLPGRLEVYDEPMPLVVEVWSPSTGEYDVEQKLRDYQLRGDAEIWRVHPYDKTLTAWRRRPDGGYDETVYRSGSVQPVALPGVTIELERLFD